MIRPGRKRSTARDSDRITSTSAASLPVAAASSRARARRRDVGEQRRCGPPPWRRSCGSRPARRLARGRSSAAASASPRMRAEVVARPGWSGCPVPRQADRRLLPPPAYPKRTRSCSFGARRPARRRLTVSLSGSARNEASTRSVGALAVEGRALVRARGRARRSAPASLCGGSSWPNAAPAARVIDSFISVPPRSLAPAARQACGALRPQLDPGGLDVGDHADAARAGRPRASAAPRARSAPGARRPSGRSAPPCARTAAARTR